MAGIILLGNVHYEANEKGEAKVSETGESAAIIAKVRIKVSGRMSLSLSLSLHCSSCSSVHRRSWKRLLLIVLLRLGRRSY